MVSRVAFDQELLNETNKGKLTVNMLRVHVNVEDQYRD